MTITDCLCVTSVTYAVSTNMFKIEFILAVCKLLYPVNQLVIKMVIY